MSEEALAKDLTSKYLEAMSHKYAAQAAAQYSKWGMTSKSVVKSNFIEKKKFPRGGKNSDKFTIKKYPEIPLH